MPNDTLDRAQLEAVVTATAREMPVIDMHTHLFAPAFGSPNPNRSGKSDPNGLLLWGVDELVTYHYLIAEVYRVVPPAKLAYEQFWKMSKSAQADHIWKNLFVDRSPVSEACRGVLTALEKLGLDPGDRDLSRMRKWFAQQDASEYIDKVMHLSGVKSITMTNEVFSDNERSRWLKDNSIGGDRRFTPVLRIDPMLRAWPTAAKKLSEWGFNVTEELSANTIGEAQRFLNEWLDRTKSIYIAVSLPPEFRYPANAQDPVAAAGQKVLEKVILPVCAQRKLPFAMMIGSRMRVNPALRDAGDMVGASDVQSVVRLACSYPTNKFFVTMLARENQHELAVAARKFDNLMIFGCWWFLNNPCLIDEITRMRMELLGLSFIPQHSDARVLDQLIYKWDHSRDLIAHILIDKYTDLLKAGWKTTADEVRRDVKRLFQDNFTEFLAR